MLSLQQYLQSFFRLLYFPTVTSKFDLISRLVWWKWNQLFIKAATIVNLTDSIRCICYPDSSYASLIFYIQYPEYFEAQFLKKYLTEKSVFIDVGAGFGDYSLLAASKIKKGKIIAFEPILLEVDRFRENVHLNQIEEIVQIENKLVGNITGKIAFKQNTIRELSKIDMSGDSWGSTELMDSVTLDDYTDRFNISFIDFLKIDTEGAEGLVLQGAKRLLAEGAIGAMIIELNPNHLEYSNPEDFFQLLKKNNYQVYSFHTGKLLKISSFPFDRVQNVLVMKKKS